jgi:hypothetical protein
MLNLLSPECGKWQALLERIERNSLCLYRSFGSGDDTTMRPQPRHRNAWRLWPLLLLGLAGPVGGHAAPQPLPADVQRLLAWVQQRHDNTSMPFAMVDKPRARIYVFDADGRLQGDAPVLLGAARGDDSVPGIGDRPMSQIRPEERTTPAGRFIAEPGVNAKGEDIVWVDYDAAVSMHRVRTANKAEQRLRRLATPTTSDNRISYGCINLPAAFYDRFVASTLGRHKSVVYVLPDQRPLQQVFGM